LLKNEYNANAPVPEKSDYPPVPFCKSRMLHKTPTPAMTVFTPSSASRRETSLSDQVFREVNRYRSDRSRQEVRLDACLGRLAHEHAKFLSANREEHGLRSREVSHYGFKKRARTAQFNEGFIEVVENVVSYKNGNGATLVRL